MRIMVIREKKLFKNLFIHCSMVTRDSFIGAKLLKWVTSISIKVFPEYYFNTLVI